MPISSIQTMSQGTLVEFPINPSDLNGNGIDDLLDNSLEDKLTVIAHIDDIDNMPEILSEFSIEYVFQNLDAVKLEISKSDLSTLISNPEIKFLENNHKLKPFLLDSTEQMGLIDSFWSNGIIGGDQMSIAVVDSGIDANHIAFADRIIASYNAMNGNATAPIDNDGHGTHVTGIAAGAINFPDGNYRESWVGAFPEEGFIEIAFQLKDLTQGQSVNIAMDWDTSGSDTNSPGGFIILDSDTGGECSGCRVESNNGFLNTTVILNAGSYLVGAFSGVEENPYEISIKYDRGLTEEGPDIKGVAYNANIVSVKVLDSLEGGELDVFDTAINWLIDHRTEYNISVVNISLGLSVYSSTLDALMSSLANAGILPVVAAGNEGQSSNGVFSPASAPEALTVGSINKLGEIAYYTNVGSDNVNDVAPKPDVLAPGGSIATPLLGFDTEYTPGYGMIASAAANLGYNLIKDDVVGYQGTSMAAPHIAGLASLIASQIHENDGWDWTSRDSVMEVKRMIQAGTYEVGNIGLGREIIPSGSAVTPSIDRDERDYHEGWGAVDTRAIFGFYEDSVSIGSQKSLNFDLADPSAQKTYGWFMSLSANTNYGFSVDVPADADLDIKIINAETGPLIDNLDYGELEILASTSKGVGEDEGVALSVDNDLDVYVIVTAIETDGEALSTLDVFELDELPFIEITSPFNGQELENPVTIEFTGSESQADLFIDSTLIDEITSGYQLSTLSPGFHSIALVSSDSNGFTVSDTITIEILEEETSEGFSLNFSNLITLISSILIINIILSRRSRKFNY